MSRIGEGGSDHDLQSFVHFEHKRLLITFSELFSILGFSEFNLNKFQC